ncbi:lipoyl(octanoyl) transferase LipB [Hoyosella sp. G463]|uniref:Octanoyltransferase n=1 Tax=Lolliginicoccus lacisalsi TaxID=2742202 RepID=A0A927JE53_9ACTN|nr:lipoyl(octanoyl) transferase LipB [Lolliginicoccus lacisalsi]MBD8507698.1 lipoyl(octanoyl) transferase LipB [Lolliginicoccus lacisalsi]
MSERSASARSSSAALEFVEAGMIDYLAAWARQREIAEARARGEGTDTVLLLEHPPVYTAGRRTTDAERPTDGTPVIDVDRGGKITWHGPGQLVGYPIVALAEPIDVVGYVRRIEEALISVVTGLGVPCGRIDGRSGVWLAAGTWLGPDGQARFLPERKIAAIGVRVARGVTLHGFALNCNNTLDAFDAIIPCGITDAGVTSLSRELGREITVQDVIPAVTDAVARALDGELPVSEHPVARRAPATGDDDAPAPRVTTYSFT